jgi:hypothetical protein
MTMKRTTIFLEPATIATIECLARRSGVSVSEVIRRSVAYASPVCTVDDKAWDDAAAYKRRTSNEARNSISPNVNKLEGITNKI